MKKLVYLVTVLFLTGMYLNCGSNQSLISDLTESSDPSSITLRQLTQEMTSRIEIPLAVFGETAADLEGNSFSITVNGYPVANELDPTTYFVDLVELVSFEMHNLEVGDEIVFYINHAEGEPVIYSGTFSDVEDSKAIIIVLNETTTDSSNVAPTFMTAIYITE